LAKRNHLPFALHFSDPVPGPWLTNKVERTAFRAALLPAVQEARFLTFTTEQAIEYMEEAYGIPLKDKSVVLRNIVPEWNVPAFTDEDERNAVVYVGQFNGRRTPFALIDGIAQANRVLETPLALRLVGTNHFGVKQCQNHAAGRVRIEVQPWTTAVANEYRRAFATAVVDADDPNPVFLPTKAGEALQAGRRIIALSPHGSPTRIAFDKGLHSVRFCRHKPTEIAECLVQLARLEAKDTTRELPLRHSLLSEFRARTVAATLISVMRLHGWNGF